MPFEILIEIEPFASQRGSHLLLFRLFGFATAELKLKNVSILNN